MIVDVQSPEVSDLEANPFTFDKGGGTEHTGGLEAKVTENAVNVFAGTDATRPQLATDHAVGGMRNVTSEYEEIPAGDCVVRINVDQSVRDAIAADATYTIKAG